MPAGVAGATGRTARVAGLVLAAAAAVAGLSGCQTNPGAAALVGDYRISTSSLQHSVDTILADPQAQAALGKDRASFTRTELGRLIQDRVIASAAAAHHVTATQQDVATQIQQFIQQAGGQAQLYQQAASDGIPRSQLPAFIRYYVLEQKLGDALVADQPVSQSQLAAAYQQNIAQFQQVHLAHIQVATQAVADRVLAQARAHPARFAALAASNSQDTNTKGKGGDLGFLSRTDFQNVASLGKAVFAARPGSFLAAQTQSGWEVVHVISRRTVPLAQAATQLKSTILSTKRSQLIGQAVTAESSRLGVHVNPRYGRWDPKQQTVVASNPGGDVSVPSPTPS